MPSKYECHGSSERDCYYLGEHHDVNGTEDRPEKELGSNDIYAGDKHHNKEPSKPYPLKPATY
ncbi:MAG: hypothetical protein PVI78_09090 [Anaerolineales bacterium]